MLVAHERLPSRLPSFEWSALHPGFTPEVRISGAIVQRRNKPSLKMLSNSRTRAPERLFTSEVERSFERTDFQSEALQQTPAQHAR